MAGILCDPKYRCYNSELCKFQEMNYLCHRMCTKDNTDCTFCAKTRNSGISQFRPAPMAWVVFSTHEGGELLRYSTYGMFPGELQATAALLAREHGIGLDDIKIKLI